MLAIEEVRWEISPSTLARNYGALDKYHYPLKPLREDGPDEPEYAEVDERRFFEMAKRIFSLSSYPPPPDPYSGVQDEERSDHIESIRLLYRRLKSSHAKMYAGISRIRAFHADYRPETVYKPNDILNWIGRIAAAVSRAVGIPMETDKSMMRNHLIHKRDFWETALAYLYSRRTDAVETEPSEDDLFDEIECVNLMHIAYLTARSACHHLKPRRRNMNLTMKHAYEVTIIEVNFYLGLLEKTTEPEERRALYRLMKKAIARAMLHDYLEDFAEPRGPLDEDFLKDKMTELSTFDTYNEIIARLPTNPGDRSTMSVWSEMKTELMAEIQALSKPSKEELERMRKAREARETKFIMEPHLRAQIIEGLPRNSALPTFFTKIADRLHNVRDLKDLDARSQTKKLLQSYQMIMLGMDVLNDPRFEHHILLPQLPERLAILSRATMEEIDRVLELEISQDDKIALRKAKVDLEQKNGST